MPSDGERGGVPQLREVWVWPPSGFTDRPWLDDADADAFARVSRAVCDRYSEALETLGITHRTAQVRILAAEPDHPAVPADRPRPWWRHVAEVGSGFEMVQACMPPGFARWEVRRQQAAVLDVVHAAMREIVRARGLGHEDRLVGANEHVRRHDMGYAWTGGWHRSRRRPDGGAPLAARLHCRLNADGFGVASVEVAPVTAATDAAEVAPGSVVSGKYPTWTTGRSFRRADKTATWVRAGEHFAFVPYMAVHAQGPTVHLVVSQGADGHLNLAESVVARASPRLLPDGRRMAMGSPLTWTFAVERVTGIEPA